MATRAKRGLLLGAATLGISGAAACTQILDVGNIPETSPPTTNDATTHHEAGMGDAGKDARGVDAKIDAGHDAAKDAAIPCGDAGATRCSPNGLGTEECLSNGDWADPVACPGVTPVCLGSTCSCVPGATACIEQVPVQCTTSPGGNTQTWVPTQDGGCPGTCTLSGCAVSPPPSCAPFDGGLQPPELNGVNTCGNGADAAVSCCASDEVLGGTFALSYDGVSPYTSDKNTATISDFRLDQYEVTVGRFRQFFGAVVGGWLPAVGSGKHVHLNGGRGLLARAADGGEEYELGWQSTWNGDLNALAKFGGDGVLQCGTGDLPTWTYLPDPNPDSEQKPINCVTWAEAYAFCIWDGGFLPSDAEWNYAAAGGSDQRYYPWSAPYGGSADTKGGCVNANFTPNVACNADGGTLNVGLLPEGGSKWAQEDLAGNVLEWTLDVYVPLPPSSSCRDCAYMPSPDAGETTRVQRGGSFLSEKTNIRVAGRGSDVATDRSIVAGFRCARIP